MRTFIWCAAYLVVGSALTSPINAAPPEKGVKHENAGELFAWFDTLGYRDVSKAPFVRITTTSTPPVSGGDPYVERHHGFLLAEDGDSYRVFVVGTLAISHFSKATSARPNGFRHAVEKVDLGAHIDRLIAAYVRRDEIDPYAIPPDRAGKRVDERAEYFMLACAASHRGFEDSAARLFALVARMPRDRDDEGRERPLSEALAESVAEAEIWNGIERFGDLAVPRAELLRHFRWMAATFPKSRHNEQMRETADMLARMVREDEQRALRPPAGKLEDLPIDKRVVELIFRLRDQVGGPPGCAMMYDDFTAPDDDADSPSHQLLRIGHDAVPQLLEAIDDKRFTRSVGNCGKGVCFGHYLHTVGGFARSLIYEIAGRSFYPPYDPNHRATPKEDAAVEKKAIRVWYDDIGKKGENALLTEAVLTGDTQVYLQASRLAEKYPADAASAIISRIKTPKPPTQVSAD